MRTPSLKGRWKSWAVSSVLDLGSKHDRQHLPTSWILILSRHDEEHRSWCSCGVLRRIAVDWSQGRRSSLCIVVGGTSAFAISVPYNSNTLKVQPEWKFQESSMVDEEIMKGDTSLDHRIFCSYRDEIVHTWQDTLARYHTLELRMLKNISSQSTRDHYMIKGQFSGYLL